MPLQRNSTSGKLQRASNGKLVRVVAGDGSTCCSCKYVKIGCCDPYIDHPIYMSVADADALFDNNASSSQSIDDPFTFHFPAAADGGPAGYAYCYALYGPGDTSRTIVDATDVPDTATIVTAADDVDDIPDGNCVADHQYCQQCDNCRNNHRPSVYKVTFDGSAWNPALTPYLGSGVANVTGSLVGTFYLYMTVSETPGGLE
ncbi:MAG TPA: hypothetical protein V6C72_02920, partial [Chroococcales cyanobacterium]